MDLGLGEDLVAWPLRGDRGSWDGAEGGRSSDRGQSLGQEGRKSPEELSWNQTWGMGSENRYQAGWGTEAVGGGAEERPWTGFQDICGKSVALDTAGRSVFQDLAL